MSESGTNPPSTILLRDRTAPQVADVCDASPDHYYTTLGLFSGAGGLDLGFSLAGFSHLGAMDIDPWSVATLQKNRPEWSAVEADVAEFEFSGRGVDVLLGGPPCQGYSLGGHRRGHDERNKLYLEMLRIAGDLQPKVIVLENVLNLRTVRHPETGRTFVEQIARDLRDIRGGDAYEVHYGVFRMADFGVPQTRRRFVFVAFRGGAPAGYTLPQPTGEVETIRDHLYDLANGGLGGGLPNHEPRWGFGSAVHIETGADIRDGDEVLPVRLSRTASDGHPIRSYDEPFPAVDTATIWGWAQGDVRAARHAKDRTTGKYVRNASANVTLWRVEAARIRSFTHREYARLQTFPDDWEFVGNNLRDIHMQIGNAVPVEFARRLGLNVAQALQAKDGLKSMHMDNVLF